MDKVQIIGIGFDKPVETVNETGFCQLTVDAADTARDWVQLGPGTLGLLVLPTVGRYVPAFVVASKSVGHVDRQTCSDTMNDYFREAKL